MSYFLFSVIFSCERTESKQTFVSDLITQLPCYPVALLLVSGHQNDRPLFLKNYIEYRLVLNARRISVLIYSSLFKFWLVHFYMMSILNMLHRSFWYMTVHIQAFESFNLKPKIYPFYPGTFTLKQKYLIFEFFPSKI